MQASVFPLLVALSLISACSLSVGAGAQGQLGRTQPSAVDYSNCNGFESCELIYRTDLERAQRCHETDSDCDDEERQAALDYAVLYNQTQRELQALRAAQCAPPAPPATPPPAPLE